MTVLPPEFADYAAAFPKSRQLFLRTVLLGCLIAVAAGIPSGLFYFLGEKAGRGETYAEAYKQGRDDREAEFTKVLAALEGTVPPISFDKDQDMDCEDLALISARAGELVAIKAAEAGL